MKTKRYVFLILATMLFMSCSTSYRTLKPLAAMDDLEYPLEVKKVFLPSSGYNIAYMEAGSSGPVVVFIHGLGSYAPAWKRNLEELSQVARCIAIDLPGYGKSDKYPHSGLMSFYAGIVNELAQELHLGKNISCRAFHGRTNCHHYGPALSRQSERAYPGGSRRLRNLHRRTKTMV
ncbi:MAG: alpha/beta fold hydrolase [Bacteroidales bacterium]